MAGTAVCTYIPSDVYSEHVALQGPVTLQIATHTLPFLYTASYTSNPGAGSLKLLT